MIFTIASLDREKVWPCLLNASTKTITRKTCQIQKDFEASVSLNKRELLDMYLTSTTGDVLSWCIHFTKKPFFCKNVVPLEMIHRIIFIFYILAFIKDCTQGVALSI